jgi:hypothetical protein
MVTCLLAVDTVCESGLVSTALDIIHGELWISMQTGLLTI